MKNKITSRLLACAFLFLSLTSLGSTIIPFHNLGKMADASTLVVQAVVGETYEVESPDQINLHTSITVNFVVKGNVAPNATLELEHYSTKGDGWVNLVDGDVELSAGTTYLFFLVQTNRGYWRPILMSYGIFEQITAGNGQSYLVPLPEWANLNLINPSDGQPIEPLAVYRQQELLLHLQQTVKQSATWNMQQALETTDVASFLQPIGFRAPPAHCSFYNIRWTGFPTTPVEVHAPTAGDVSCTGDPTTANTYVAAAVSNLTSNYSGINLTMGATYSGFVPDCTDGSAVGDDFTAFVNSNLGGTRNIVIIYNDPCNQIPNLSGCSGTLGLGGVYGFSPTYTFDGATYYAAAYGYVIVNNNVCSNCSANTYTQMLTHEITHTLGVGHIAGSGTANMNPSCCTPITNLDRECLNYFYPSALPVELVDFSGKLSTSGIELNWETASELNNLHMEVERSADGRNFETIGRLAGAGSTNERRPYQYLDRDPLQGINYYRLRQTDYDGNFSLSAVISVEYKLGQQRFLVLVNPIKADNLRLLVEVAKESAAELQIIDTKGSVAKYIQLPLDSGPNYPEIALEALPAGLYFAKIRMNHEARIVRFVK